MNPVLNDYKTYVSTLIDFKAVSQAKDHQEALESLKQIQSKWEKPYPRVIIGISYIGYNNQFL